MQRFLSGRLARGALAMMALAALLLVAFPSSRAEAATPHLTTTTVSCPTFSTYGTPATCTLKVTDVTPFVTKKAPTGKVAIDTILNRLDVDGSPCTLAPISGSASQCSVTVTPTDIGPIVPGAAYTPTGDFILSVGVGATMARPADLTITADAQSRDYGSANPTLTATYTGFVLGEGPSDLVGTLECTTTALTTSVPGDYPITCGGQDSLYYYIDWVDGTLTVDPAPLTITADDQSRDYAQANPTLTATYDGFVLGQDASDLTGTLECSTTATLTSPAGNYPITCGGQTSTNYAITDVEGNLAVDTVPLVVTANNAQRGYGAADPTFSVTYEGFVDGEGPEDLGGELECMSTALPDSPVGEYPISCGGLTSTNYDITYVDGMLDVETVPLTITANHAARLADTANPAFTASYDGFVLGQDASALTGTLVCATTAVTDSAPGAYPIGCSGLTSTNYDITWVDGTLDVFAAPNGKVSDGGDVKPGGTVKVDTDGWMPGSTVTVTACDVPLGQITVDEKGKAKATFDLPSDLPLGDCSLVLSGTDEAGGPYAVVLGLTVSRSGGSANPVIPAGLLPYTGAFIGGTTLFGLIVLGAGVGMHLVHRRRQHLTPAVVRNDERP